MDSKDNELARQQQERRKRVSRIKTGIIMTIAIWIAISILAIVVLGIMVVKLNSRIYKLELQLNTAISSTVTGTESDDGDIASDEESSGAKTQAVVKQLESKDNVYHDGDTRKVYLTFDCIPGDNTGAILDALANCGVKATFFVTADTSGKYDDVYKRIVQDGHTIAMASYSNSYSKIYESTEAFTDDLTQISDYITNLTGIVPDIYRFPGGSMNQISNVDMVELVKILNSKHITYFDWNVNSGDTADNCSVDDIVNNVTSGIAKYDNSVVLLHDDSNRSTTAEAIEPLVESIKAQGAEILPIDNNTYKVQYITNKNTNWKDIGEYSTTKNNTIDFTSLGLEDGEYVKEYRICFGKVKQGFTQVEAPKLLAKVNDNVQNNKIFVNRTYVTATYQNTKLEAKDNAHTVVYTKTPAKDKELPKTGLDY